LGKKEKNKVYEKVEIVDVAAEGKAIGRIDGIVVFVTGVVPGDIVDVLITRSKNNYKEGIPVKIHSYSSRREPAFCKHFGDCGGCKWQEMPYEDQLGYKQKEVASALKHIGRVEGVPVMPILASENKLYYRNKLEYTFCKHKYLPKEMLGNKDISKDQPALGFHARGLFDKVIHIDHCYLQGDPSNRLRNEIGQYALENGYTFYDMRQHVGELRNLVIRTSTTGELMCILIFADASKDRQVQLLEFVADRFPEITALLYIVNQKMNDTYNDLDVHVFRGRDHIFEEMEGLKFKIGPKSFYQTNPQQAYELYKVAREFAQLDGSELVYDLYTGTGTIANFVARKAKKVIGVEYVPEAIEDAIFNSQMNGIDNTQFYAGDMKDVLSDAFIAENGQPDVIITDPPRAGMHADVVATILRASPKKIVYVSCNPATQARDVNILSPNYVVTKIQPVDMFPHTFHLENVILLEKI